MDAKAVRATIFVLATAASAAAADGLVGGRDGDALPLPPWLVDGRAATDRPSALSAAAPREPRLLPETGPVRQAANWTARSAPSAKAPPSLRQAERLATRAQTRADLTRVIAACDAAENDGGGRADKDDQQRRRRRRLAAWAHNRRGELLADGGDPTAALNDFEHAVSIDDSCWPALHNRGVTLAEQGRFREAVGDFSRVIELNPGSSTAYRNRGEALAKLGDTRRAVTDFTAALALGPVDAGLLTARGAVHHRRGQIDLAVADFNLALSLAPGRAETLARRGEVYAQVGSYERAKEDFERSLEAAPRSPAARRSYAWLLATCPDADHQDPALAVEHAQRAIELAAEGVSPGTRGDNDLALHLDTLAVALAAAGQQEDALHASQLAVDAASGPLREAIEGRLQRLRNGDPVQP